MDREPAAAEGRTQPGAHATRKSSSAGPGDGLAVLDATGRIRAMNQTAERLSGWTELEARDRPFEEVFRLVEERTGAAAVVAADAPRAPGPPGAVLVIARDGTARPVAISGTALRSDHGTISGEVVLLHDRTAERQTMEALTASETRYRRLFESAKDGILILDSGSGVVVDVNPFLLDLLRLTRDEVLGAALWDLGFMKDLAASHRKFSELQRNAYVRYEDLPLRAADGRTVHVEFVSNVYLVDGREVIQCNIRDITERRRAEDELLHLRQAVEGTSDAIFMTDPEGVITFVNPAFTRLYGFTAADLVRKKTPRVLKGDGVPAEDYAAFWATLLDRRPVTREISNKTKSGGRVLVEATANAILDEESRIVGFLAIQRDVTERRRAAEEREKLEEGLRASQKMDAIGSLAGGVAHDFNNLLSVILTFTSFALDGLREGDPLRDDLAEVRQAGERAAALTRQLMAFGRKQILQPRPVDLNQIASGVERMLDRIIGEDIELRWRLAGDLGLTLADPGQMEQVLMNLVVNARDALPAGGAITIETANVELDEAFRAEHGVGSPGPHVLLAVTDTGSGMDERTLARIFEPFFTTKERGKGTGLGLSTAYGIVKQSGGDIRVRSEPGRGSSFEIYLPRTQSPAEPARAPAAIARPRGTETILVVEDEDAVRNLVKRILGAAGYTVLAAANGGEALMMCEANRDRIDLLLTDVVMPRMSGFDLADRLAQVAPRIKVLYMSGYADRAESRLGPTGQALRVVSKPFGPEDLTRRVREALDEPVA